MKRLRGFTLLAGLALVAAASCKPDAATQHREKGNELINQSQWKEAAAELALSLEANPKQEELWEQKAYAHMQLQEFDQVEAAMTKLAEFKTEPAKKAEVFRNVGGMYVQHSMNDKAEPMFIKAMQVDPKDDQSVTWLAEIYSQRGGARANNVPAKPEALDKAMTYLDQVIAMKPTDNAAYFNKRIALTKYLDYWQQQRTAALTDLAKEKDPAKQKELQAKADDAQGKFDALKKKMDEIGQKLAELAKSAQGK